MSEKHFTSEKLTPEEVSLIQTLFGIGRRERTLDEIVSENSGVTRGHLEDVEARALRKLRYQSSHALRALQKAG